MLHRLNPLVCPIYKTRLDLVEWEASSIKPSAHLIHENLHVKRGGSCYIKYGWCEAVHAARDRFAACYIHRHTEEEVCSWFREAGYAELQCAGKRERPGFVPISLVVATAVDGVRG